MFKRIKVEHIKTLSLLTFISELKKRTLYNIQKTIKQVIVNGFQNFIVVFFYSNSYLKYKHKLRKTTST